MKKLIYPKVAIDMYRIQLIWALGYLGVLFIIHVIKIIFSLIKHDEVSHYFANVLVTANIFMLVIGIISTFGLLRYFVENGVTRKDYFKGATLASIGLSVSIAVVTSFISLLEFAIFKMMNIKFIADKTMLGVEADDFGGPVQDIIGNVVISAVLPPFVSLTDHWLLAVFVLALNLFFYYLVGWFISASFYRLGGLVGLVSIVFSFVIVFLYDFLLRTLLNLPTLVVFDAIEVPMVVTYISIIIIISIIPWMIRQLTKRVPIKN